MSSISVLQPTGCSEKCFKQEETLQVQLELPLTYFTITDKIFWEARKEHAFLLRCEGLTFREISERLGVSKARATQLVKEGTQRLCKAANQCCLYFPDNKAATTRLRSETEERLSKW